MATKCSVEANYAQNADGYSQFMSIPLGKLEKQLLALCIHNLDGQHVLDLGGGAGLRAREAIEAGAAAVDVVDISPEMMYLGQAHEQSIGRDIIKWHQGDASKPLEHLHLGPYDVVISNGIFDHARDDGELDMMWRNSAAFLKPGGLLIANRNNPWSRAVANGKYGVLFDNFQRFSGGSSYRYRMLTEQPLEFRSIALDSYCSGSLDIPGKYFRDFRNVPWDETPLVQSDRKFWEEYLADPILYIFTARKVD